MGRWRPPAGPSTALITRPGFERLRTELDELWRQRRPEVVAALAAAAAEGDRSENAEYTYRKKQLGEIDRRVRYLSKRLPSLRVVDQSPTDPTAVYFGAWLSVAAPGETSPRRYRIVGPDETDARRAWISIDSPLARALLGRRRGDRVELARPDGNRQLQLLDVGYDPPGETAADPI